MNTKLKKQKSNFTGYRNLNFDSELVQELSPSYKKQKKAEKSRWEKEAEKLLSSESLSMEKIIDHIFAFNRINGASEIITRKDIKEILENQPELVSELESIIGQSRKTKKLI